MKKLIWSRRNVSLLIVTALALLLSGCSDSSSSRFAFANQGSPSAPVTLTVGQTHNGTVAAFGTSFYRFTTTVGGVYTISLTNTASDLSWELAQNDGTYIDECDTSFVAADEICFTDDPLLPATPYIVIVEEWDTVGGRFNLLVSAP